MEGPQTLSTKLYHAIGHLAKSLKKKSGGGAATGKYASGEGEFRSQGMAEHAEIRLNDGPAYLGAQGEQEGSAGMVSTYADAKCFFALSSTDLTSSWMASTSRSSK